MTLISNIISCDCFERRNIWWWLVQECKRVTVGHVYWYLQTVAIVLQQKLHVWVNLSMFAVSRGRNDQHYPTQNLEKERQGLLSWYVHSRYKFRYQLKLDSSLDNSRELSTHNLRISELPDRSKSFFPSHFSTFFQQWQNWDLWS